MELTLKQWVHAGHMTATLLNREQGVPDRVADGCFFRLFKVTIYFHYHDLQPVVSPAALLHRSAWKKEERKKNPNAAVFFTVAKQQRRWYLYFTPVDRRSPYWDAVWLTRNPKDERGNLTASTVNDKKRALRCLTAEKKSQSHSERPSDSPPCLY